MQMRICLSYISYFTRNRKFYWKKTAFFGTSPQLSTIPSSPNIGHRGKVRQRPWIRRKLHQICYTSHGGDCLPPYGYYSSPWASLTLQSGWTQFLIPECVSFTLKFFSETLDNNRNLGYSGYFFPKVFLWYSITIFWLTMHAMHLTGFFRL